MNNEEERFLTRILEFLKKKKVLWKSKRKAEIREDRELPIEKSKQWQGPAAGSNWKFRKFLIRKME